MPKPMNQKKISTTVYITEKQNECLKRLSEKTNVPVAVFIRQGIDLVLEKHQEELSGQLSLLEYKGGRTPITNH